MPVELVGLDVGHAVEGAEDVGDGEVGTGSVEHESTVRLGEAEIGLERGREWEGGRRKEGLT